MDLFNLGLFQVGKNVRGPLWKFSENLNPQTTYFSSFTTLQSECLVVYCDSKLVSIISGSWGQTFEPYYLLFNNCISSLTILIFSSTISSSKMSKLEPTVLDKFERGYYKLEKRRFKKIQRLTLDTARKDLSGFLALIQVRFRSKNSF